MMNGSASVLTEDFGKIINEKLQEKFQFQNSILKQIPEEWENYQVILGNKISIDGIKWMKGF